MNRTSQAVRVGHHLILTMFVGICLMLSADANEKTEKQVELKALQQKIEKLKQSIDVKENSKSTYTSQLKNIEQDVAKVSGKIRDTKKKINASQAEMKKLKKSRSKHQQQLVQENDILAKQVYTAFTLGEQDGKWLYYCDTGELWKKGSYKSDKREGLWITYFESGQKYHE